MPWRRRIDTSIRRTVGRFSGHTIQIFFDDPLACSDPPVEQDVDVVALSELVLDGFVRPAPLFNVERLRAGSEVSTSDGDAARLSSLSAR